LDFRCFEKKKKKKNKKSRGNRGMIKGGGREEMGRKGFL